MDVKQIFGAMGMRNCHYSARVQRKKLVSFLMSAYALPSNCSLTHFRTLTPQPWQVRVHDGKWKAGVCSSPAAINTRPQSYHLLMLLLSLSLVFTTIGINKLMRPRCSLLQTLTVYCPNPECRTFKMLLDVVVFKFCSLLGSRGLCGLTQLLH